MIYGYFGSFYIIAHFNSHKKIQVFINDKKLL